ncbi:MAG: hypothetical protein AVDCRST_MAG96-2097 [uncultured Segetibacter sp.]|uniref:Uncharacterized protein n=1 Tax=uncultured Segetibacter sp. TaxID=481133 RepID=A0A6J4SRM2_9BACT|nr:MAG: hypothetical protein AVDCRST_MAG96-2097 [uncultured Segetibacter sp.]
MRRKSGETEIKRRLAESGEIILSLVSLFFRVFCKLIL